MAFFLERTYLLIIAGLFLILHKLPLWGIFFQSKTQEDLLAVWIRCLFGSPTLYCLTGHWQMCWKLKEGGVNYVQFHEIYKGNSPEEKKNGATFKNLLPVNNCIYNFRGYLPRNESV